MAPQFTETKGSFSLLLYLWMSLAISLLPVPDSPRISTVAVVDAIRLMKLIILLWWTPLGMHRVLSSSGGFLGSLSSPMGMFSLPMSDMKVSSSRTVASTYSTLPSASRTGVLVMYFSRPLGPTLLACMMRFS